MHMEGKNNLNIIGHRKYVEKQGYLSISIWYVKCAEMNGCKNEQEKSDNTDRL